MIQSWAILAWAILAFIAFVPSAPLIAFGIRAWAFDGERQRSPLMVLLGLVCGVVFCVADVESVPEHSVVVAAAALYVMIARMLSGDRRWNRYSLFPLCGNLGAYYLAFAVAGRAQLVCTPGENVLNA